jgi:hypothetical protein
MERAEVVREGMGLSADDDALRFGMVENRLRAVDLRLTAPRAPQMRLGRFAVAARVLDKCRAELAGINGDYHFNCPLDRIFFGVSGLKAETFSAFVATGADDQAVADWIRRESTAGVIQRSVWNFLATIHPGFLLMNVDDWLHARRARG